jgi:predicted CoA-binding protein
MRAGVESFLAEKRIAVVGVSRRAGFANTAMKSLRAGGWEVFPVNAVADEVEGEHCWHAVGQVPGPVGAVLCVVPPAETEKVVEDCVRAGIGKVWMQQGSESPAAIRRAEKAGMTVVHHACVLMYAKPAGVHRFHGFVERLRGRW